MLTISATLLMSASFARPAAASTNQALPARTPSPAAKRLRPMTAGASRASAATTMGTVVSAARSSPASSKKKPKKKTGASGATPKRKARPKTAKPERETKTVSFDSFLTVSGLARSHVDGSAVVTPTKQPKLRSLARPGSAPPKHSRQAASPAGQRLAGGPLTPQHAGSAPQAAPWTTSSASARQASWNEAADAAYALLAQTSLAPYL